jgi:hypothetical protein
MLLFQYTYYVMREPSKRWGFPVRLAKFRALVVIGLVKLLMLVTGYVFIARIILGHNMPNPPLPPWISPVIAAFAFGLVVNYINILIIGHDNRVFHYKVIFDTWDKGKRLRWKILLISIAGASLAVFFLVGEVSQKGLNPQNWKY